MQEFFRIRRLPPYVFEQVNRAKAAARNAGADIIDLGMGNPDLPAPLHVVDKLKETVGKPRTDRYSASRGIPGLRRAQAAYYRRRFGVKLDPEREIVATLGSKEGFANVAQAIIAPGDVVLVPNPSYPIHAFGFLMAGGVIRSVPSEPTPLFFEALERAVIHSIPQPIAVVVCYPANPTAYVACLDFYRDLVAGATCSWNPSAAPAGRSRRRAPRCSPGRRSRRHSSRSGASSSQPCWSRRRSSRSRPASPSASMARASCASRWSRTSSASGRPPATSAVSLKPASKSCTTSFPSPRGADAPACSPRDGPWSRR